MGASSGFHNRIGILDALRGFAIIAVLVGHANLGVIQAGMVTENVAYFKIFHIILYSIHLPLLAFLLGFNFSLSFKKSFSHSKLLNKIFNIFYLYLLWTLIQGTFQVFGSRFANNSTSWGEVLNIAKPIAHLWFLPWVIIVYLILGLVKSWKNSFITFLIVILFSVISPLVWGYNSGYFYDQALSIVIFSVIGALWGKSLLDKLNSLSLVWLCFYLISSGSLFALCLVKSERITVPTLGDVERNWQSILSGIILAVAGTAFFLILFSLIYRKFTLSRMEYVGINSMAIYLVHLLILPPLRIVLMKIGFTDPYVALVVVSLVGLGLSIVYAHLSSHKILMWSQKIPFNVRMKN